MDVVFNTGKDMQSDKKFRYALGNEGACGGGSCCVAIPLENDVLSAHFGHCVEFSVLSVKDGEIVKEEKYVPPQHAPGVYPRWLSGMGVTDVIAGGIGQKAIGLFNHGGINVFAGAPVKSATELVIDFLSGKLHLEANYCDHNGNGANHGCKGS